MNQTYFTVLIFSLSFLFGATIEDRCTKHSEPPYLILTECPSSEKFNLLECYHSEGKNNSNDVLQQFWCWNRKDNDEKVIKDVSISTARVEVNDLIANINQPFLLNLHLMGPILSVILLKNGQQTQLMSIQLNLQLKHCLV